MTWLNERIETNGIQINVHRTGGENKPAVILMHGITDDGLCWTRTARDLEADYDVVMIDARGHGDSDKPTSGYTPGDQAADLAGVIRHFELKRPVLVGHSMGGQVAAHAAAMYPEKLRGVCLIDPPFWDEQAVRSDEELKAWLQDIQKMNAMTQADLEASQADTGWDATDIETWAASKRKVSPEVLEYAETVHTHWRELLPRVEIPALLMYGDDTAKGAIITQQVAEEAAALLEKGEQRLIRGAGHSIQRDNYADYLAALRDFLARLWK